MAMAAAFCAQPYGIVPALPVFNGRTSCSCSGGRVRRSFAVVRMQQQQQAELGSPSHAARTTIDTLRDAVAGQSSRPSARILSELLLKQEMETRALSRECGVPNAAVGGAPSGEFRLWFATGKEKRDQNKAGGKVASGRYVPGFLDARIAFDAQSGADEGVVRNSARLGGAIGVEFEGWFRWAASSRKITFNFYSISASVLGARVFKFSLRKNSNTVDDQTYFSTQEDQKKLPFFIFFIVDPSLPAPFAAARGRGGGLAIWRAQIE